MANTSPDESSAEEYRALFEEHARSRGLSLTRSRIGAGYYLSDTNEAWHAWLAVRATPPSPSTAPEVVPLPGKPRSVYAHPQRGALYDSIAMDAYAIAYGSKVAALASRPRIKLDPELKAALEEAAKTGATSALLPDDGAVFINRGHDYGDNAHLECTACGGSGHIDDQRQIALSSRPAEVDDEGLPPLPEPLGLGMIDGHEVPAYTAEQFRQGQRDAVAADRARRQEGGS